MTDSSGVEPSSSERFVSRVAVERGGCLFILAGDIPADEAVAFTRNPTMVGGQVKKEGNRYVKA